MKMMSSDLDRPFLARIDKHLATCATAAAAVGAVSAMSNSADAAIKYSGPLNVPINSATTSGLYIDVDGLTTGTSSATVPGFDFNVYNLNFTSGAKIVYLYTPLSNTTNAVVGTNPGAIYVGKLGAGTSISSSSTFVQQVQGTKYLYQPLFVYATSSGTYPATGNQWAGGVTGGYMGFKFLTSGGQTDYGWMRFNISTFAGGFQTTLVDFAYEDGGTAITAGAGVPEPASAAALGLLALGASGIRPMRRGKAELC